MKLLPLVFIVFFLNGCWIKNIINDIVMSEVYKPRVDNTLNPRRSLHDKLCKQGYENCRILQNNDKYCKDKWCNED